MPPAALTEVVEVRVEAQKAAKGAVMAEQPKGRSGASLAEVGFSSKKMPDYVVQFSSANWAFDRKLED